MKHVQTFESFLNESKYKGNISGDAAEYIAKELSQYVKGIISQPNDNVTYFHLKDKSDKSKVIKTLLDVYGVEALDGGTMFSPSPTIKFDNNQILESFDTKSVQQEVSYMAPSGRASLQKYNEKVAKVVSDDGKTLTIQFKDGKQLTEVPKEQVRYLGESVANEGFMSDLDLLAQDSGSFPDFVKNAKKGYPQIAKMKGVDEWLKEIWDNASEMKESFNFQLTSHSKAAADVAEAIEKNAKFVNENDMAELLSVYANTLKKTGYIGLDNFK